MKKLSRLDKLIYFLRVRTIKKYCVCTDKIVMDVGCGYNADFLRYIKDTYHPARAIAYDLALHKKFLAKEGIICKEGDLNHPFQIDEKVDLIFATAILEHLSEPVAFLQECFTSLETGGCLLLTTPSIWSQPVLEFLAYRLHVISAEEISDHKEYYDKQKLFSYLTEAGFTHEQIHHEYFECYMNNLIVAYKK